MKGCLEVVVVLLLGAGVAAWIVREALRLPETPAAIMAPADPAAVKAELSMLKRQFQTPEDYQKRLAAQNLTEQSLQKLISVTLAAQSQLQSNSLTVTEKEVRTWFEAHRESLRIPETFHAAHVFLTRHEAGKPERRAEILAIQRQLLDGSLAFREAAARYSEDKRTQNLAGDLGWFTADRMPADLIAEVRKLQPGETSPPVSTRLGWHLIHLLVRRPSRLPTLEESRAEIRAALETKLTN